MPDDPCADALHALYHYLDNEVLTDEVRARIAQHLDDCPKPCGEAFAFEEDLRKLIVSRCQEQVPEALRHRIAQAIGHE